MTKARRATTRSSRHARAVTPTRSCCHTHATRALALPLAERAPTAARVSATRGGLGSPRGGIAAQARGRGVCRGSALTLQKRAETLSVTGLSTRHPDALQPAERAPTARKVSAMRQGLGLPRAGIAAQARGRGACRGSALILQERAETLSVTVLTVQHPDALQPAERAQTARKVSATRGGLGPPRGGIAARARERGACRGSALTLQKRAETLSVMAVLSPRSPAAPGGNESRSG